MVFAGPGEPLGAFVAAYIAIEFGILISGKTKLDIILTPLVCIGTGSAVGLFLGPPISRFMNWLGSLINWGTEQQPFLMGIVVSVLMGMILTLPISSAALGIILNLSGLAAGAATIGCCCNMVGFAVASYRGRTVPERGIPIEVGAVVDNVGTVLGIYRALTNGDKVTDKYLSVVGEVKEPIMLKVPIGTSVRTCIEAAQPAISDYAVILGGPMMGKVFADDSAIDQQVVTKTTEDVLAKYFSFPDQPFGQSSAGYHCFSFHA